MKKYLCAIAILPFLFSGCSNDVDSPKSEVYRKEYRTLETIREDEIFGTVHKISKFMFDVPYNGHESGYVDWRLETWNKDSIIECIQYIHPFRYKQTGQLIVVNYDIEEADTILYFVDSIVNIVKYHEKETYYYYGPVSIE
jgi:hypothetical protein